MSNKPNLSVSSKLSIVAPVEGDALPVPFTLWNRIMEKIKDIGGESDNSNQLGWACVGIAGSFAVAAAVFPFSTAFTAADGQKIVSAIIMQVVLALLGPAAGLMAWMSFRNEKRFKKMQGKIAAMLIEEMEMFGDKHKPKTELQ